MMPHPTASGRAEIQTPFLSSSSARPSCSVDPPAQACHSLPWPGTERARPTWARAQAPVMHDTEAGDFTGWVPPSVAFPHCMSPELGNRLALLARELLQGLAGADSSLSRACPWHCPARAWHVAAFIKATNIYEVPLLCWAVLG